MDDQLIKRFEARLRRESGLSIGPLCDQFKNPRLIGNGLTLIDSNDGAYALSKAAIVDFEPSWQSGVYRFSFDSTKIIYLMALSSVEFRTFFNRLMESIHNVLQLNGIRVEQGTFRYPGQEDTIIRQSSSPPMLIEMRYFFNYEGKQ